MLNEKLTAKAAAYKKANNTLQWLQATFPNAFVKPKNIQSPLKIGIHIDLKNYIFNEKLSLSYQDIRKALGLYVNHYRYQTALFIGNTRIDLTGNVAGQVTEDEVKVAKEKVRFLNKKFRKRKAEQKQSSIKKRFLYPCDS
jgi:ProP effector